VDGRFFRDVGGGHESATARMGTQECLPQDYRREDIQAYRLWLLRPLEQAYVGHQSDRLGDLLAMNLEPKKLGELLTLEEITRFWIKQRNTKAPLVPEQYERRKQATPELGVERRKPDDA
jgi:hypothetical protein